MFNTLELLFNLLSFRNLFGGQGRRPIHFSARSRRRMNRVRFVSHLE